MSQQPRQPLSIWWFALGYFASYVPYSLLTKGVSKGLWPAILDRKLGGFEILPLTTLASLLGMAVLFLVTGWWRASSRRRVFGVDFPVPQLWTFLSGLSSAAIIATTTLAYTFEGASILLMMLLMRGGVLVLAPVVDSISGRKVRWFSWVALVLSLLSLGAGLNQTRDGGLPLLAFVDVAIYLASYFVRLRFMSHLAKSSDRDARLRYFVEEQLVATPAIVAVLGVAALVTPGAEGEALRQGFSDFSLAPVAVLTLAAIGLFSQGTGVFGALILLDARENTFCVPVNRASSVLAGSLATLALFLFFGQRAPGWGEIIGAVLLVAALLVLGLVPLYQQRKPAPPRAA